MKPGYILIVMFLLTSCHWNPEAHRETSAGSQLPDSLSDWESAPQLAYVPPVTSARKEEVAVDVNKRLIASHDKKKIIKDGSLTIQPPELFQAKKDVDSLINKYNAYYQSEDFDNNNTAFTYDLTIRIPSSNFENFIRDMEHGKGEILAKSIQAQDVTEEYIDVETRLDNKRVYLTRYKELLQKAYSVKDILALQENIRVLQEEIESREGRLKYMDDQVSYSTLTVSLVKEKEFVYKPQQQDRYSERVKSSMFTGWASLVNFTLWTFLHWPLVVLSIPAYFLARRFMRKKKIEKEANH